jgi:RimJ/RimL family protein N-acetyltransferase
MTQRLLIRPWQPTDREFVYDMYSRWEVQRYLGRQPQVMASPEAADDWIARVVARDDDVLGISAVVGRDDGQPLGTMLLKQIPWSTGPNTGQREDIEIGWHFHPDAWGHGYATEAAAAVLAHAFDADLPFVVAVTYPENVASQQVARRIGMTYQGPSEKYYDMTCELFTAEASGRSTVDDGS